MKRELHYFLMADLDAEPVTALANLVQPPCYIFMQDATDRLVLTIIVIK